MKQFLLAASISFFFSGCYTMLYPPPGMDPYAYQTNDSLIVRDTLSNNGGVTIINQNSNQIILDRYYEDPFYYRGGFYGGMGIWDPYYYDHRGYGNRHRWGHGRYYDPGTNPGPVTPPRKTPRREKDERRSEGTPVSYPNQSIGGSDLSNAPVGPTVIFTSGSTKDDSTPPKEAAKPSDDKTQVAPAPSADTTKTKPAVEAPKDTKDDKKSRRENVRGR